jgi:N-acyl amino acid synthase of PEP-CTERM/exosortase system
MTSMPPLPTRLEQSSPKNIEPLTKQKPLHSALQHFPYFFSARLAASAVQQRAIYRLRHQVYCEELNFEPVRASGLEHDEFDSRSIHCFINHTATDNLAGTVRLITTNRAEEKLPIEHYCQNSNSQLTPKHFDYRKVCEISRLAVPASIRRRLIAVNQGASPMNQLLQKLEAECYSSVAVALYLIATLISVEKGKHHAFVMVEPALARILRRIGIHFQQIGDSINFNGKRAPYYLDMRTVTSTLKPDYLTLHSLLADQLGVKSTTKDVTTLIKTARREPAQFVATSRAVATAAFN